MCNLGQYLLCGVVELLFELYVLLAKQYSKKKIQWFYVKFDHKYYCSAVEGLSVMYKNDI